MIEVCLSNLWASWCKVPYRLHITTITLIRPLFAYFRSEVRVVRLDHPYSAKHFVEYHQNAGRKAFLHGVKLQDLEVSLFTFKSRLPLICKTWRAAITLSSKPFLLSSRDRPLIFESAQYIITPVSSVSS